MDEKEWLVKKLQETCQKALPEMEKLTRMLLENNFGSRSEHLMALQACSLMMLPKQFIQGGVPLLMPFFLAGLALARSVQQGMEKDGHEVPSLDEQTLLKTEADFKAQGIELPESFKIKEPVIPTEIRDKVDAKLNTDYEARLKRVLEAKKNELLN